MARLPFFAFLEGNDFKVFLSTFDKITDAGGLLKLSTGRYVIAQGQIIK